MLVLRAFALATIHGILRTLLLVPVMGDLPARRVSTPCSPLSEER
jgi:hypothetical protein